jgi:hypothetical protein
MDDDAQTTLDVAALCYRARLSCIEGESFRDAFATRIPAHARLTTLAGGAAMQAKAKS